MSHPAQLHTIPEPSELDMMHDECFDNVSVTGTHECYEPSLTPSEIVELLHLREVVQKGEQRG